LPVRPLLVLLAHLDDLEDFFLAEDRMRDFRAGDAIPLATLKAELGLDD
jgi:RHH-type rel operon transcriptional repressor/antitoxin RelB